jgi:hypothetical protein
MSVWRVGTKLGRTLYVDDKLVGMLDTPELAETVVRTINLWRTALAERPNSAIARLEAENAELRQVLARLGFEHSGKCYTSKFSSRMCEIGTAGCELRHE